MSTDVFYPQREDRTVDLRVHVIPGAMVFDDYLTGTTGLTYSDSNIPGGVPIDGTPDAVPTSLATWQMVQQAGKAALVTTSSLSTDIAGLVASTYYLDQKPASPTPCTGDTTAWGQDGQASTGPGGGNLPCTDPTIYGSPGVLSDRGRSGERQHALGHAPPLLRAAGFSATQAAGLAAATAQPEQATVSGSIG